MEKIDVVIAWVDGNDPQHATKRQKSRLGNTNEHPEAVSETRFSDLGEIYYCIASILKYAAFINKIWIVTDDQCPEYIGAFSKAGLCAPDFVQIVDHKVLFVGYEEHLPTFNSLAIEAVLWRIPALADQYVYMNDDFFFNQPISPEFLFMDGKPVLRGWMARPNRRRLKVRVRHFLRKITFRQPNQRPSFRFAQDQGASLAGVTGNFLHVGHHPHPMRRSVQENYFATRPDVLKEQISHQFRNVRQYLPVSLANHLEINHHSGLIFAPVDEALYKYNRRRSKQHILDHIAQDKHPTGCLQSLDETPTDVLKSIRTLMSKKLGAFLPAEIDFHDGEG